MPALKALRDAACIGIEALDRGEFKEFGKYRGPAGVFE
jgi:hypothetical protein